MSFRKYAEYKESGVVWLGEIPSHWLCISLKNIEPYNSQMVQTGPFGAQLHASDYVDEGVPLILIKNVRNLAIDDSDIPKISVEDAKRLSIYRVEVGDIVFSRVGSIGRIAKITEKERGWLISGQMLRLRLGSNSLNPEYSVYALSSKIVEDYVTYYSVGATRDSINTEILMNLKIPLPSLEEQKRIAAFLDKETTKIDTLIDKQEQLITLLQEKRQAIILHAVTKGLNPNVKMKDSGIAWLGKIPTHWLCVSLKNIEPYNSQMVQTGPFGAQLHASDYVDEGVPLILIKNVRNLSIDDSDIPKISTEDAERLSNYRVEIGDIVFSRVGSIGRIAKITEKERGWLISGQMLRLRLGSNSLNPAYSVYALSSKIVEDYVAYYSVGSTRDSINTEILMNLKIPLPPVKEQKQIAAFLDKETKKIDTLIEKCETAIELLKERRTALISAAVTGKIDVRNAV